jgi:hypothetical protein
MDYNPNYEKARDSGSSGVEISDLNPGKSYDVDIRRLPADVRGTASVAGTANEGKQRRVEQYMKAKRSAGKYRQKRGYDEPYTDMQGQTPAFIEGEQFGKAGATNYADKPQSSTNKLYY